MRDKVFLDTNVIVYLFDKSEDKKHKTAKELFNKCVLERELFISAQVINEFVVIASQKIKNPLSLEEIKKRIAFLSDAAIVVNISLATCNSAINLKSQHKISYWDALIAASALENKCAVLYTEDLHNGLVINDKLSVSNPFL
ncbi:MAG: PIN domain-containing protein [Nitrospirae bacterium]|nr:PIN domain-containing protein [Nitrospirota bacterium]